MQAPKYAISATLSGDSLESVIERVTQTLADEGFGVLTHIDISGTLQSKLDLRFRPYAILGACNPKLAAKALGEERHMGLLMPCNVVVQALEADGRFEVSFIDPDTLLGMVDEPGEGVREAIADAGRSLRAAASKLDTAD